MLRYNKRAGHHRHNFRLHIFVFFSEYFKEGFEKNENVFLLEKKYSFFILFSYFSILKTFWLFPKNSYIRQKKRFKEIMPFDRHSTADLPPLMILKKNQVFSKKTHLFFQKKKFWTFWQISQFQLHSMANVLQFGEKREEMWTQLEKSGRRRQIWSFWAKNFHPFFLNLAKNNKNVLHL